MAGGPGPGKMLEGYGRVEEAIALPPGVKCARKYGWSHRYSLS